MLEEAVYHYVEGADFEGAADLMETQVDQKWRAGEIGLLQKWMDLLPDSLVSGNPKLSIYKGWMLLTTGRLDMFTRSLKAGEKTIENLADSSRKSDLQGRFSFLKSVAATFSGHHEDTAALAENALKLLDVDNITWRSGAVMSLGDAKATLGKLVEADQAYTEAVKLSMEAGNVYMSLLSGFKQIMIEIQMGALYPALEKCDRLGPLFEKYGMTRSPMAGCVTSFKGSILCEFNHTEEGLRLLEKAVEIADADPHIGMKGWCYLNLTKAMLQLGETGRAETLVDHLLECASETQLPPLIEYPLETIQAGLQLFTGNFKKVEEWIKKKGLDLEKISSDPLIVPAYLVTVRFFLLQNNPQQAIKILNTILSDIKTDHRISQWIEVLIFKAIAINQSGNTQQALSTLVEALILGEDKGFLSTFRDCRIPLPLLESARAQKILPDYVTKIIDLTKKAPMPGSPSYDKNPQLPEQLSRRESEVLKLLAEGLSNQEICESLYLAMDTVKGHTRRIYAKLDVHSHSQAVATARKMGILS